uniref:Uncharacterized protein n=1 Tax=virus sp. ctx9V1 TaxID=2828001 RepID=A0A8S5RCT0_9VIRU|nr:MAG TPA: hypothetical protein [virus sp. ctx9V1]
MCRKRTLHIEMLMLRWLLDLAIVMHRDCSSLTNTDGKLTIEPTVLRLRVLKHTYLILVLLVRNGCHNALKTSSIAIFLICISRT